MNHRQGALKAVDDPILQDAGFSIFPTFIDIMAPAVAASGRYEFDRDGWRIAAPVQRAAEAGPDQAVGNTSTPAGPHVLLGQGAVQGRSLRVVLAVREQK